MKLQKHLSILLFVFASYFAVEAQTISAYFTKMPSNLLPGISLDTKLDLIDFQKNGKVAAMPAAFGGKVELKVLSDDYMLLKLSEASTIQLKLLNLNDSVKVLVLIRTAAAPLRDSRYHVYDTNWKPLEGIQFPQVSAVDFLDKNKVKDVNLIESFEHLGLRLFLEYSFKPQMDTLYLKSALRNEMSRELKSVYADFLKDSLVYTFKKGSFLP